METSAFEVRQSFQALRQNESIHALVSPFGFFQDRDFQLFGTHGSISQTSIGQNLYQALPEEVIRNFIPASIFGGRSQFKQQTFAEKPLSDEQVTHANQLASEFEDQDILRRLLRR